MESVFSNSFATILTYAITAILSLGTIVTAGCMMSRAIRQSGACTFLWQEESMELRQAVRETGTGTGSIVLRSARSASGLPCIDVDIRDRAELGRGGAR